MQSFRCMCGCCSGLARPAQLLVSRVHCSCIHTDRAPHMSHQQLFQALAVSVSSSLRFTTPESTTCNPNFGPCLPHAFTDTSMSVLRLPKPSDTLPRQQDRNPHAFAQSAWHPFRLIWSPSLAEEGVWGLAASAGTHPTPEDGCSRGFSLHSCGFLSQSLYGPAESWVEGLDRRLPTRLHRPIGARLSLC